MLIAEQKRQENIAEYILLMYQIEDLVRSTEFDLDRIMETFVKPQLPDDSFLEANRKWYADLIRQMRSQQLQKSGHILEIKEILVELSYLHNTMLNASEDGKYKGVVDRAIPFIDEFKERSNLKEMNHIEIALHAMYMKLLLRLQKKEITSETEEAFDAMRMMLAFLSRAYKQMKSGDMNFMNN
ncbi:MAG: DUF4924 family protein [Crocinitomicaceae bacterium]